MPAKTQQKKANPGNQSGIQKPLQPSQELAAVIGPGGDQCERVQISAPFRCLSRFDTKAMLDRRLAASARISKQGDVYIRRLLILGGASLVRYARRGGGSIWAKQLLAQRPTRIVTVALANKAARVIWALFTRGEVYRAGRLIAH